jgi:hypothetical protein
MHYLLIYMKDSMEDGGEGWGKIFRNKKRLAAYTDGEISYAKLVYHFTRKKKDWIRVSGFLVVKVVSPIEKGLHGAGQGGNLIAGGVEK